MAFLRTSQTQTNRQQQRTDPRLLMSNRILLMPALELEQWLAQEVVDNPALELRDGESCEGCPRLPNPCWYCPYARSHRSLQTESPGDGWESFDPTELVAAPFTLHDALREQLQLVAEGEMLTLGLALIEEIDEDGYLRVQVEELARRLEVTVGHMDAALQLVQSLDPAGVGARSLQECLLLQLQSYEGTDAPPTAVQSILERGWRELSDGKIEALARRVQLPLATTREATDWIRSHLQPYPGRAFRTSWQRPHRAHRDAVRPDVVVELDESGEPCVRLTQETVAPLGMSRAYRLASRRLRESPHLFTEAERRQLQEQIRRATLLLEALVERGRMLRLVVETLLDEHREFFRTEREADLAPITRARLAALLRVHESTISRCVADKYLRLPSGRTLALRQLFDQGISHRSLVARIVADEDPTSPYSDQQIADLLRQQGIEIARRTVLKYREEMNILSSRHRARMARQVRSVG